MNQLFFLAICLLGLFCGSAFLRADGPDDEYVRIYNLIQQADALAESGRNELARQKYSEAHGELDRVRKAYPGWNEQVIQFRLNYIREKLGMGKTAEKPKRDEPADSSGPVSAEPADRIKKLLEEMRQLTADKELLQAKLKEALSAQPVAVDPRELARSEEMIKALRKEIEVLTVSLKKAETKPDQARKGNLESEKPMPEARPDELASRRASESVAKTQTLEKELADARRAAQTNAALVSALQIALRRAQDEKDALLDEHRQARRPPAEAPATTPSAQRSQIESLSDLIAVLRARLEALEARAVPYTPEELALFKTPQSISAIAKFSDEKKASSNPKSSGNPAVDVKLLVGEAERAFAARHYDEAEKKYAQALRLDEKNVLIRANLAAAQIGQNRLAEGEATLKRALAGDPSNAAILALLGVVKVRQHKYDEALDLLSQSAQIDPQNADTFHYLGVTLAAKGMRRPSESAFRRAIQLAPDNAEAHHNLAIVYATQQPPALELARLHYQKGLAGGHPKDSKLEQMLRANKPATVGGVNALNR